MKIIEQDQTGSGQPGIIIGLDTEDIFRINQGYQMKLSRGKGSAIVLRKGIGPGTWPCPHFSKDEITDSSCQKCGNYQI